MDFIPILRVPLIYSLFSILPVDQSSINSNCSQCGLRGIRMNVQGVQRVRKETCLVVSVRGRGGREIDQNKKKGVNG